MAYAFSTIRDSMTGDDRIEKTNIFSPNGLESGLDNQVGINPSGGVKTDAGGDGMAGGGTPGETPDQSSGQIAQQRGARQAISRNAGRINTQALTNVSNAMKSADSALQDEANRYVSGAKQKGSSFAVDDGAVDSYIQSGDDAAGSRIKSLLESAPQEYEAFQPKTDVSFGKVDELQTDEGFKNVLRREGGPEYTSGMGAFDVAAARRSPQFSRLREDLKKERDALVGKSKALSEDTTKTGRDLVSLGFKEAQNSLRSGLTAREKALMDAQIAESAALNAAAPKPTADDFIEMGAGVRKRAMDETPDEARLDPLIWGSGVSARDFYSSPTTDWRDVVDESEAAQFNRIMSALNRGDVYTPGSGPRQPRFDEDGYRKAVMDAATGKRGELDKNTRAQIDSYLKNIESELPSRIDTRRKNELQEARVRLQREFGDDINSVSVDPTRFYGAGTTPGAPDFFVKPEWAYNEDDIRNLSNYYTDLGEQNPYQVGQGLDMAFDERGYYDAMREAVTGWRAAKQRQAEQEYLAQQQAEGRVDENGMATSDGGPAPVINRPGAHQDPAGQKKKKPTRIPVVSDVGDVVTGKKKVDPRKWF